MLKNNQLSQACAMLLLLALTAGCKKNAKTIQNEMVNADKEIVSNTSAANTLVFRNRFQGTNQVVQISPTWKDDLTGNDGLADPSDWTQHLEVSNPYFSEVFINYEQGTSTQRKAEIIADPTAGAPAGNKVLKYRISESHITLSDGERKGRIQVELNNKKAMPAGGYLREYRQKVRMYLHPDFNVLVNSTFPSGPEWVNILEFWNDPTWQAGTYDARLGIYLTKTSATSGSPLRFLLSNETMLPTRYDNYPPITNTSFAIPLGKWMTIELYIKEGDASTGKVEMRCTVDGVTTTIFNKVGITKHPNQPVADGMTSFSPMKLYVGGKTADRFSSVGKSMVIYWDDLEIYTP